MRKYNFLRHIKNILSFLLMKFISIRLFHLLKTTMYLKLIQDTSTFNSGKWNLKLYITVVLALSMRVHLKNVKIQTSCLKQCKFPKGSGSLIKVLQDSSRLLTTTQGSSRLIQGSLRLFKAPQGTFSLLKAEKSFLKASPRLLRAIQGYFRLLKFP